MVEKAAAGKAAEADAATMRELNAISRELAVANECSESSSPGAGREAWHGGEGPPAAVGRRAMPAAVDPAVNVLPPSG